MTIDRDSIARTAHIIEKHVRRTPVIAVEPPDFGLTGAPLILKLELFQHSGSFKARGAFTNLLTRSVPAAGVVAASGGNHGVAVAFAAKRTGVPARIFVPSVASASKLDRIRSCGAELVIAGELYDDALKASEAWAAESGAMPIHAYDQPETLMGQGTLAMELEAQCPDLDTLLVAVGGGGLIGGVAAWYAGRVKLIGVEPEACPTLENALRAGKPVDAPAGGVAADSLAPKRVGELMFPLAQQYISQVVLVSDDDIRNAQRELWRTARIAAEPGGAAAMAALISRRYQPAKDERVGIVVCGGNTDAVRFA